MGFFSTRRVYLDYASAPPVLPAAVRAMREAETLVGNPGAIHAEGVAAARSLADSRAHIAAELGCKARELLFTSGLTEANNLAIVGFARALERARRSLAGTHWLVSSIEHASVLECFVEVERMGGTVSYLEPDARGIVPPKTVQAALRPETTFLSVGWANNELGTVQPLADIARTLHAYGKEHSTKIIFHTDAGQAPLYRATSGHSLGVDLMSLGGNKLYGPHGVGALFVKSGISLAPVFFGGRQERGLVPGTESVALAAGFAAVFAQIARERDAEAERLGALRDALAQELEDTLPGLVVNGDLKHALPHMLNVSIPNISTEYLTLALDHEGIAVSTKSACREGEESKSHVVAALGGPEWRAQNTLRFSLGRETADGDIKEVARTLEKIMRQKDIQRGT